MTSSTPSNTFPLDRYQDWELKDAKARFSEVVRLAREQAPQRITVQGEDAVAIMSAQEFAKLLPLLQPSLHTLLSQSPLSRLNFEQTSIQSSVGGVELSKKDERCAALIVCFQFYFFPVEMIIFSTNR